MFLFGKGFSFNFFFTIFDCRCDSVRGAGSALVPSRLPRSFEVTPHVLTFLCKHYLFNYPVSFPNKVLSLGGDDSYSLLVRSCVLRLGRGKDAKKHTTKYLKSAHERITLRSAATAWAHGVPWGEAVDLSRKVIAKVAKAAPKSLPSRCEHKVAAAKAKAKARNRAH